MNFACWNQQQKIFTHERCCALLAGRRILASWVRRNVMIVVTRTMATKVRKAAVRGRLKLATKGMKSAGVGPPCFSSSWSSPG